MRGTTIGEFDSESTWQNRQDFLMLPINEWPCMTTLRYLRNVQKDGYVCTSLGIPRGKPAIEIDQFSNYIRLICVTARILGLLNANPKHFLFSMNTILKPHHLDNAKLIWVKIYS